MNDRKAVSESEQSSSLDPSSFDDFRQLAHALLDTCIDHMQAARDRPWRPVDPAVRAALSPELSEEGIGDARLMQELAASVLPYGTGNTHPRFFGWVHGTGLGAGLLAEMAAATMNSNCGGRDHGAVYVERTVIDWARQIFGFPENATGLLTTGTSQATLIALAAARTRALGNQIRSKGLRAAPDIVAYASVGAHSANQKALELMGHGSKALRRIPTTGLATGIDLVQLREAIASDRVEGKKPFCVIATAGSVDTGAFDDLEAIADRCAAEDLWMHVDGAFGCWARIADTPWSGLARGIERADSLAFDFHKWLYVQYDCGAVLIRDADAHRETFAMRPAYLAAHDAALGGGEPWFCDYGIDLSRGFRALKVWAALRAYGMKNFTRKITDNCGQAARMATLVEATEDLELAAPVILNVCCFRYAPQELTPLQQDAVNKRLAERLQLEGKAVLSTTRLDGRIFLRAAIVNHRTRDEDIVFTISAIREACEDEAGRAKQLGPARLFY